MEPAGREIILPKGNMPWYSREEMYLLRSLGLSVERIAEHMGCSKSLVHRHLSRAGMLKKRALTDRVKRDRIRHFPSYVRRILDIASQYPSEALERQSGVSDDTINRFYRGASIPTIKSIEWIANACGYRITVEKMDEDSFRKAVQRLGAGDGVASDDRPVDE